MPYTAQCIDITGFSRVLFVFYEFIREVAYCIGIGWGDSLSGHEVVLSDSGNEVIICNFGYLLVIDQDIHLI